jgi:hypothetical protein
MLGKPFRVRFEDMTLLFLNDAGTSRMLTESSCQLYHSSLGGINRRELVDVLARQPLQTFYIKRLPQLAHTVLFF